MNIESKLFELTQLIRRFLDGSDPLDRLNEFVWEVIEYFSDSKTEELPPETVSERAFWYAVWRIQHLVGEPDDSIKGELPTILFYLTKQTQLPAECEGRRPVPSEKRQLVAPKLTLGQAKTALTTANESYKGSTRLGHALSKHAGRNPDLWGKITGRKRTWNDQGMRHFREIYDSPGAFQRVTEDGITFLEKRLHDGRGIRLQLDYVFKGFID